MCISIFSFLYDLSFGDKMIICGVEFKQCRSAIAGEHCCEGCPFTVTDLSEYISNLGCLPDWNDIVKMYLDGKGIWKCHDKDRPCGGLLYVLKQNGVALNRNNTLLVTSENPLLKEKG